MNATNYYQMNIKRTAAKLQSQMNSTIANPSKSFAKDLDESYYVNMGLSESCKAMQVSILCDIETREDGTVLRSICFWVPVSVVKDSVIPQWFVNKMINEKFNQGNYIVGINHKMNN